MKNKSLLYLLFFVVLGLLIQQFLYTTTLPDGSDTIGAYYLPSLIVVGILIGILAPKDKKRSWYALVGGQFAQITAAFLSRQFSAGTYTANSGLFVVNYVFAIVFALAALITAWLIAQARTFLEGKVKK